MSDAFQPALLSLLWKGGSLPFYMDVNVTTGIAHFPLFKVSFPLLCADRDSEELIIGVDEVWISE
jgi:hypothetical protein